MATRQRSRRDASVDDQAWMAAFLGDDCPADFNPFVYEGYFWAVRTPNDRDSYGHIAAAREAWPRLRAAVLNEWKRRKHKGSPPGAVFDKVRS